ncbi:MAG: transglycosylase SLT domain-containing protein [Actinomycetota bacterium]
MSDISGLEPTSFARLDALARRGRHRSGGGPGAGFDALVAEATSRMMKDMTTGSVGSYDNRPRGALGMAAPGAPAAALALPPAPTPADPGEDGAAAAAETLPGDGSPAAATTPVIDQAVNGDRSVGPDTPETNASADRTPDVGATSSVSTSAVEAVDGASVVSSLDPSITKASVSVAGRLVLQAALDQVGAPYRAGGTDPEEGFDPAGLVRYAYRAVGVEMPAGAVDQATMGVPIETIADALPGDLISFGQPTDHVALYAGDQNIVHAPAANEAVRVEALERPVESIRRIVTPGTGPAEEIRFTPGDAERLYQPLFDAAGGEWNVSPALLAAIAETESNFDPTAVSPAGAQGLMQFMPATAREMNVDPWDPASAIDGAARYMRTSLDQFQEPELAIASYNAGRGAVSRYGGIPPFNETQNYVRKVVDAWRSRS